MIARPTLRLNSERDKPLSFDWRAKEADWCRTLDLSPAPSRRYEIAREAILLDAVAEAHGLDREICYSRRRAWYAGKQRYQGTAFRYDTVRWSVDDLAGARWLETWKAPAGSDGGRQSTLRASPGLLAATSLPPLEFVTRELVRLKDSDGRLCDYRDTERTHRMRRDLQASNAVIADAEISLDVEGMQRDGPLRAFPVVEGKDGPVFVNTKRDVLYRVFNGSWTKGGRFYGHWAQNVPKKYRDEILINGEPCVEHDYPQLHPALLYARIGKSIDRDPYDLPPWPRPLAKQAVNIVLNAPNWRSAAGAIATALHAAHPDMGNADAHKEAARLIRDIKDRHRPIAPFFHSGVGIKLQYVDSNMAQSVMRQLRKDGIVTIPIHDSFLVPISAEGQLLEAMNGALADATNGNVNIKVDCREFRLCTNGLDRNSSTYGGRGVPWVLVVPLPSRQLDLFGPPALNIPHGDVLRWSSGVAPRSVRDAVERKRRFLGFSQENLAARIGLSRSQLSNGLRGRFGFGPAATAGLKNFLFETPSEIL